MLSGIIGVPLGSYLAQRLRSTNGVKTDPLICAVGLIISGPLVYSALVAAPFNATLCYGFVFFAEIALNLSWSIVADILLVRMCIAFSKKTWICDIEGKLLAFYF